MAKLFFKLSNSLGDTITVYNNIISISFTDYDRGNFSDTVNWGIHSNEGTIIVQDSSKQIYSKLSNNYDKVRIYLSVGANENLLKTFLVDDFYSDRHTKELTIKLKDSLLNLQNINVPKYIGFDEARIINIWSNVYDQDKWGTVLIDSSANYAFFNVKVFCPYVREGTAWSTIDKFCASNKLRVCEDKNGTPTFYDSKSNVAKNPIIIRSRNVFDIPSKEKVKIPNVSVSVKNIVKYENEIIDREFAFNLYQFYQTNIPEGAGPSLIDLRWVGDNNANVGALRLLVGSKYSGIGISTASINIPTNLFKFELEPTIKIIKNVVGIGANNITEEIIETPTYEPTKSETSLLDGGKIYAQFEDWEAISDDKRTVIVGGTIAVKGYYFEESEDNSAEYVTDSTYSETTQIPSNELMQSVEMYENFARETVEAFNGIDCYEIECSFGDYYYENGDIALDFSQGQSFQRYDTVTPYVFIDGVEQPLKSYQDEFGDIVAKSFNIVGIRYNYDGHLTQKLMLQETRGI